MMEDTLKIEFCSHAQRAELMRFIGDHWSHDHVLAKSPSLLQWQHEGTENRDLDYVIARNNSGIQGVLGFICTSRFDPSLSSERGLWLALWKVKDDAPAGCGLGILGYLTAQVSHVVIGTLGLSHAVVPIFSALGYQLSTLVQSYVLHPNRAQFRIAKVPAGAPRVLDTTSRPPCLRRIAASQLRELTDFIARSWPNNLVPRKSSSFFARRFIEHPFYDYQIYAIDEGKETRGLFVARLCNANQARALRIVDGFLPQEALCGLGPAIQKLLIKLDAEYADLFHLGIEPQVLEKSGLLSLDPKQSRTIIPNYFEPFSQTNTIIRAAFKASPDQRVFAMKADADQDRPNQCPIAS